MALPGLPANVRITPVAKNRDHVIRQLLGYFQLPISELRMKSRKRRVVQIRYIMFYFLHNYTGMTLQEIADVFKPAITDHSTVIHGIQFVREQISLVHENEVSDHVKNIQI